jgi:Protein of unknown function (DUF3829)
MRHLLLFLGLVLLLGACKKNQSSTGEPAQEAMSHYAKGFNALLKQPNEMVEEYFENIPQEGPAAGSKPRLFARQGMASNAIKEAKDAFKAAKASAPASLALLAPAADKAIAAVDKVHATYSAAQKYYDAKDYEDDQLAKGKELHQQMVAHSKELAAALHDLQEGLSRVEDQQSRAELEKLDRKEYGYWFRYFNQQAKSFVNKVEVSPASSDEAFPSLDQALTEMTAMLGQKPDPNTTFKAYVGAAERFHSTAKKLVRAAKDSAGGKDAKALASIQQESRTLIDNYNALVSMAGSLYELEANKLLK